jgi:acyl carrier protein
MVPTAVVFVDTMPLTPTGKIDRRALPPPDVRLLPPPDVRLLPPEVAFVAPRTPAEEAIAAIWAEVLGMDRIGVEEDFFDLGGHSLLATQIVSRVRDAFGVELPLRRLFETPTVAGLALSITERQAEAVDAGELASLLAELEAGTSVGSS